MRPLLVRGDSRTLSVLGPVWGCCHGGAGAPCSVLGSSARTERFLQSGGQRCLCWRDGGATVTPSFAGEGVTAARLGRLTGRGRCDVECPAVEAELVDVLLDARRQGGAAAVSRGP